MGFKGYALGVQSIHFLGDWIDRSASDGVKLGVVTDLSSRLDERSARLWVELARHELACSRIDWLLRFRVDGERLACVGVDWSACLGIIEGRITLASLRINGEASLRIKHTR